MDFLCRVEAQVPPEVERLDAIVDNLGRHPSRDLLLFQVHAPRGEFVYQPTYAASLNWIEPWGKIRRSLALTGRRFETWEEVVAAVEAATAYGDAHKHPFGWGRRRRHQPLRPRRTFPYQVKMLRI